MSTKLVLLIFCFFMLQGCIEKELTESQWVRFFVGTGTSDGEAGLFTMQLDMQTGALKAEQRYGDVAAPNFLVLSPDRRFLYTVNRTGTWEDQGAVSAFSIDAETGALTFLNEVPSAGQGPCYINIDPSGQFVVVANYSSGTVALYPVNADGTLEAASSVMQHEGSGPDASRQEGPHAHYIHFTPDGQYVLSADLGIDKVMIYALDKDSNALVPHATPYAEVEAGSGPRHLAFHPTQDHIYLLNELSGTVTVFKADFATGGMEALQTISSLPDGFSGANKSADIHVHPSGKFLYASNRGDSDSIAIFSIDASGLLTYQGEQSAGIVWPRNFAIDPTGTFMLVANRHDNSIVVFRINEDTGALEPASQRIEVPEPVCIRFLP